MLGTKQAEITAGSEPIPLTAVTRGINVGFTWNLLGPGQIKGSGITVLYIVPTDIEGTSENVIITVTAKDNTGSEATDSITFSIFSQKSEPGMSIGTKVALGAGAAALLGAGIVIANQSDTGDAIPSLSGTWIAIVYGTGDSGSPFPMPLKLVLTQKGNEITGSGQLATLAIDYVTGTYTYPNVSLTLSLTLLESPGYALLYLEGTLTDKDTITGTVSASGYSNNYPVTLKRQ